MKDTIVFSKTVSVPYLQTHKFPNSLCVLGDLRENCPVSFEIFGDLYVTGEISLYSIHVHGNIFCGALNVCYCTCDGDIHIDSYSSAAEVVCMGNFSAESVCAVDCLTVHESVSLYNYKGNTIRAIDDINCHSLTFSQSLIAGGNVNCADEILPSSDDFEIFVKGNLMSKNIRIGGIV